MAFKIFIISSVLAVAAAGYVSQVPAHYETKVVNPSANAVASTHQNVVRTPGGTISHHSKSIQTPYSSVHKEDTRINNNVYTPALSKSVTYNAPEVSHLYTSHSGPVVSSKTFYNAPQIHEDQNEHLVYASPAASSANVYTHSTPSAVVYTKSGPSVQLNSQNSHVYASAPTPTSAVYSHSAPTTSLYQHEIPSTTATQYATHGGSAVIYHQEDASKTNSQNGLSTIYHHEVPSTATTITTNHHHHQAPAATLQNHEVPSSATTIYNHSPAATTYSHSGQGVSAYGSSQTIHYSPAEMVSHMSFDGFGTHWGY